MNRYIAKYDFEIARKLKGTDVEKLAYTEKQRIFHRIAMLEMLHDISVVMTGGIKYFNRLNLLDGTFVELDITSIPEECKLLVVSHVPDKGEVVSFKEQLSFQGIKGNIYENKDDKFLQNLAN